MSPRKAAAEPEPAAPEGGVTIEVTDAPEAGTPEPETPLSYTKWQPGQLKYQPPVHEALAAVMAEIRAVPKGERFAARGMESYNFRGVDAVVNAVGPMLRKHQVLGPTPQLVSVQYDIVPVGRDQTPTGVARVVVRYRFTGPRGDHHECEVPGAAMDRGDKAIGKAMSVAMRIALIQTLCLPTHEPDPDSEVFETSETLPAAAVTSEEIAAEVARTELLDKINRLKLDPASIAAAYMVETGQDIRTDSNADRIRGFADRMDERLVATP